MSLTCADLGTHRYMYGPKNAILCLALSPPGSCWIRLVLPGSNKERCDLWEIDGITVINGVGRPSGTFGEWKRVRGELGLPAIQT